MERILYYYNNIIILGFCQNIEYYNKILRLITKCSTIYVVKCLTTYNGSYHIPLVCKTVAEQFYNNILVYSITASNHTLITSYQSYPHFHFLEPPEDLSANGPEISTTHHSGFVFSYCYYLCIFFSYNPRLKRYQSYSLVSFVIFIYHNLAYILIVAYIRICNRSLISK